MSNPDTSTQKSRETIQKALDEILVKVDTRHRNASRAAVLAAVEKAIAW